MYCVTVNDVGVPVHFIECGLGGKHRRIRSRMGRDTLYSREGISSARTSDRRSAIMQSDVDTLVVPRHHQCKTAVCVNRSSKVGVRNLT